MSHMNIHMCVCAWMCVHLHAFWEGLERDIFIWMHLQFPWIANKHVITFVCPPPRPLEHIHHSGFPAVSDLSSKVLHYSVDQCGSAYYSIISSPHFSIKSCMFSSFPCAHIQIYVHKKSMEVSMWKRPGIRKLYNIYKTYKSHQPHHQKPSKKYQETSNKNIKKPSNTMSVFSVGLASRPRKDFPPGEIHWLQGLGTADLNYIISHAQEPDRFSGC